MAKRIPERPVRKAKRSGAKPIKKSSAKKPTINKTVATRTTATSKKAPTTKRSAVPENRVAPKVFAARTTGTGGKKSPRSKKMTGAGGLDFAAQGVDVGGRIIAIVQDWAKASSEPASDTVLSSLWADSGISGPFTTASQDLAQRLNKDLGSSIRGSDIKTDTTVSDLIQMIV